MKDEEYRWVCLESYSRQDAWSKFTQSSRNTNNTIFRVGNFLALLKKVRML